MIENIVCFILAFMFLFFLFCAIGTFVQILYDLPDAINEYKQIRLKYKQEKLREKYERPKN